MESSEESTSPQRNCSNTESDELYKLSTSLAQFFNDKITFLKQTVTIAPAALNSTVFVDSHTNVTFDSASCYTG